MHSNQPHDDRFSAAPRHNGHGLNGHNGHNGHHSDHLNGHNGHHAPSANKRHLSEISHLFLSDLRRREGEAPQRVAPGSAKPAPVPTRPSVGAVVGAKLNGALVDKACAYAAGVAASSLAQGGHGRVGLAVVEATEFRLLCVDADAESDESEATQTTDLRTITAAVEELACDIDAWLVILPDPRLPHARRLLAQCERWTLLTTADHEGIVSGYRTLKGLCNLEIPDGLAGDEAEDGSGPMVSVAMLDAATADEAERAARKLIGVCQQFLDLPVGSDAGASAHHVASSTPWSACTLLAAHWKSTGEAATAWVELERRLLSDDITAELTDENVFATEDAAANEAATAQEIFPDPSAMPEMTPPSPAQPMPSQPLFNMNASSFTIDDASIPPIARPMPAAAARTAPQPVPVAPPVEPVASPMQITPASDGVDEVIDLPAGCGVVEAALSRGNGELAMTAISPPMLPTANLAVRRDGVLVLVAAAAPGLTDLPLIGRAMAWVAENRVLLGMALNQYRLDLTAEVAVQLFVSHTDAGATALRPLLGNGDVTIRPYRRLRWGGREGLLLEAA